MEYKRFFSQHMPFMAHLSWKERRLFFLADRLFFGVALTYASSVEIMRIIKRRHNKELQ